MDRNKALGLALALSFVGVACAAPAIATDVGSGDPADQTSTKKPATKTPKAPVTPPANPANPTPPADPTQPGTPPVTPPVTPGANCKAEASFDKCAACCDPAGDMAKAQAVFEQCSCGGGACTAQCQATACAGKQPSAACDTCVNNTCTPQADAACTSAGCKAAQQCFETSGCDAKP